ncbi:50S ribosomal protein L35 [Candidatus Vidania fulgoroideorum]
MIKTNRSFYKRIIKKKGKIKLLHNYHRHLLTKKTKKRKRKLKGNIYIRCQG